MTTLLLLSIHSPAAPLGTIPTIEEDNVRLLFEFRSDLWTSPHTYKEAPITLTSADVLVPIITSEIWKISASVASESLSLGRPDLHLGENQVFVGSNLQSRSVGLGARMELGEGSSISGFAAWSSASDEPKENPEDEWIESNLIYWSGPIENRRWMIALNHSHNRGFLNDQIFPYFGVRYEVDRNFTAVFGFPFLWLTWEKPEHWKKEFKLTPFGVHYELQKELQEGFYFHALADYSIRSYLNASRTEDESRLYFQECKVEGNLRNRMTETTGFIFGLGYAFGRRLYEAIDIYDPQSETMSMDNDLYAHVAVEFHL